MWLLCTSTFFVCVGKDYDFLGGDEILSRDGMELVYHRLPWREPDAPYLLQVLYEDDDMVSVLHAVSIDYFWVYVFFAFMFG